MKRWLLNNKLSIWLKRVLRGNFLYCLWLLPLQPNKLVVSRNDGKGYGGNAKYLMEELLKRNLDVDIVWLLKNGQSGESLPEQIRAVPTNSYAALYELATAGLWIDNTRKYFYPPKRKKQFYLQTWHSSLGVKYLERDAALNETYRDIAKRDGHMTDLMVAGSGWREILYKRSFWYEGEVLVSGTPRIDVLMGPSDVLKEKVCASYKIPKDTHLVLYAPTFRNNPHFDYWSLEADRLIKALSNRFGGKWEVLFRLHPKVSNLKSHGLDRHIIDATHYDDMQELLAASDVLITDYSSSMFDMMIAGKKCFLYMTDKKQYLEKERSIYFRLDKLPFSQSETMADLTDCIEAFNQEAYEIQVNTFYRLVHLKEEGDASRKIVDRLIHEMKWK